MKLVHASVTEDVYYCLHGFKVRFCNLLTSLLRRAAKERKDQ